MSRSTGDAFKQTVDLWCLLIKAEFLKLFSNLYFIMSQILSVIVYQNVCFVNCNCKCYFASLGLNEVLSKTWLTLHNMLPSWYMLSEIRQGSQQLQCNLGFLLWHLSELIFTTYYKTCNHNYTVTVSRWQTNLFFKFFEHTSTQQ